MPASATSWSIRGLLNPVVVRLLIFGLNPFDLERVVRRIEETPLRNARQLEATWLQAWGTLAQRWRERGAAAAARGQRATALDAGLQAAGCTLAQFLINPGEISRRRAIYFEFAERYRSAVDHCESQVRSVKIPMGAGTSLAGLLHLPRGNAPHPCVALFSGLGSCKEEVHPLARLMVERGVAAVVPDLPGCGESLLRDGIVCGSDDLSAAFHAVADFIERQPELDPSRFGASGMCMGGGYAYRACAEDDRYSWCAPLFPLFISKTSRESTPQWMMSGEWYDLQTGGKSPEQMLDEVGWHDGYRVACPLLLVHGSHDNWMTVEYARRLYEGASSPLRELVVVEEEPAYSTGEAVMHTMPVGEQLSWVGPRAADWIAERAGLGPGSDGLA